MTGVRSLSLVRRPRRWVAAAAVIPVVVVLVGAGTASATLPTYPSVYQWGQPPAGPGGEFHPTPAVLPGLPAGTTYAAVSAGNDHVLILTSAGNVYAAGDNTDGQLGRDPGPTASSSTPLAVSFPPAAGQIVAVSAGWGFSLALTGSGTVYAWGRNTLGQIGADPSTTPGTGNGPSRFTPTLVTGFPVGHPIVQISAGAYHGVARANDGTVWSWGYGGSGELGNGNSSTSYTAVQATNPSPGHPYVDIAASNQFTLAVTDNGAVHGWGDNFSKQVGDETQTPRAVPTPTHLPSGYVASAVAAAQGAGYAIVSNDGGTTHTVASWGRNDADQLGRTTGTTPADPGLVAWPSTPPDITAIDAGDDDAGLDHVLALAANGAVWDWGRNGSGQLGRGSSGTSTLTPDVIAAPAFGSAAAISAGGGSSYALPAPVTSQPDVTSGSPPATGKVGQNYGPFPFTATGFPVPTYAVQTGVLPPGLTLDSDGTLHGQPTTAGHYTFTVRATNTAGTDDTGTLTIDVPNPPTWSQNSAPATATVGTAYNGTGYTFIATGSGTITYGKIGTLPPGLSVNTSTGLLSGTPTTGDVYDFTITATDVNGTISTPFHTFTVTGPPHFTAASPPTALSLNVPMTAYDFIASGYPKPTFTTASGNLPDGLTLESDGTLHGKPTVADAFQFTVQAENGIGSADVTGQLSITVTSVPQLVNKTPPDATRGVSFAYQFTAAGSPAPTFAFFGSPPPGMTLDSNGLFHGTPTGFGTEDFHIVATNSQGNTGSQLISWMVNDLTDPVVLITGHPSAFDNHKSPTITFTAADPDDSGAALKADVVCKIDGTVKGSCSLANNGDGSYSFGVADGQHTARITVTDPSGNSGTTTFTWNVDTQAPTVSAHSLPRWTLNDQVEFSYSGNDHGGSGTASYDLYYFLVGPDGLREDVVRPPSWQGRTESSVTKNLKAGSATCFGVQARDRAGNVTPNAELECTSRPFDDRALSQTKGWTDDTGSGYFNNTFTSTKNKGETLTRKHIGVTHLALIAYTCPSCGRVGLFLRGNKIKTWDLHSTTAKKQVLLTYTEGTFPINDVPLVLKTLDDNKRVRIDGFGATER
jgi:alpha-tubulin suppressor-like RCC1 family protein